MTSSTDERARGGMPLVGRDVELRVLRGALQSALARRGGLVSIAGEPGIGKTRLIQELAAEASNVSLVAWGRCWEDAGAPAYWPWVEVLRSLTAPLDDVALRAVLGVGASRVAAAVPDVAARLTDIDASASVADTKSAEFALFDAITQTLRRLSTETPITVLLEDVHAADTSSLRLLHFVSDHLDGAAILVVISHRERDARARPEIEPVLADVVLRATTIRLHSLGVAEVGGLVEATTGVAPSTTVLAAIAEATGGNPLFVTHVARMLRSDGRLLDQDVDPRDLTLPEEIRILVRRRLAGLDDVTREALTAAAIVGPAFSLSEVTSTTTLHRRDVEQAADHAHAAGLLVASGVPGRWQFAHGLIRATLYDDQPLVERARRHWTYGSFLRDRDELLDLPLAAHHLLRGATAGDPVEAARAALQAARAAYERPSFEDALTFLDGASAVLEDAGPAGEQLLGEVLLERVAARRATEDDDSLADISRVVALARRTGSVTLLASAALLHRLRAPDNRALREPEAIDHLEEALAALQDDDDLVLRARVTAQLAISLRHPSEARRQAALADEALELARQIGDDVALVYALEARHLVLALEDGPIAPSLAVADELVEVQERLPITPMTAYPSGRIFRAHHLLARGDLVAYDVEIARVERLAVGREPFFAYVPMRWRSTRALLDGRLDESDQLVLDAFNLGLESHGQTAVEDLGHSWLVLRWLQGRMGEFEDALRDFSQDYPEIPYVRPAYAFALAEVGKHAAAAALLAAIGPSVLAMPVLPFRTPTLTLLTMAAAAVDDATLGSELRSRLAELHAPFVVPGLGRAWLGSIERPRALAAALTGDLDAAVRHADSALDEHRRVGALPYIALSHVDLASLLVRRGRPTDRGRATALAQTALDMATTFGMPPVIARASALLGDTTAPSSSTSQRVFRRAGDAWT
ncbi:MAG: AAA family ATPase, partial [Actinobacteria bacterium]|nr:AAA family ATPase [Actinomycetota bacterium]